MSNQYEKEKHAERRKKDISKALRKKRIAEQRPWLGGWYDNLHQYSKNKIHCSCPSCTVKTNRKDCRGKGYGLPAFSYGETNHRRGKNWTISDMRKIERLKDGEESIQGDYEGSVQSIPDDE